MDLRKRYIVGQLYLVPRVGEAKFIGCDEMDRMHFVTTEGERRFEYDPISQSVDFPKPPSDPPITASDAP
jgi:hypothetical protein